MDEFKKQVEQRYLEISLEIEQKEKEVKSLREERLPLADMLDKWGIIPKKKRLVKQ